MIARIADNILSPLGLTTEENYLSVKKGESRLARYEGLWGLSEPFCASLFTDSQWEDLSLEGEYTRFERLLIHSISQALSQTDVDTASRRVLFVISTTKGNIELLDPNYPSLCGRERHAALELGNAARQVSRYFHNENTPVVVSNACISGLSAQIEALRAISSGRYDTVIVSGTDVQSRFILSGFQSFKAVSQEPCRPFDIDRCGLNLGEAAATLIYSRLPESSKGEFWLMEAGAVRNDASHISNPSKTAEGCFRALSRVLDYCEEGELALVNAHGTSTLYNDEMEAMALKRAQLSEIPVNSLKGYYGHTMGAAGILETIITMHAIDDHTVLGTRGFEERGVSCRVNVSGDNRPTDKRAFVKLISGFGGCNAAMLFRKGGLR